MSACVYRSSSQPIARGTQTNGSPAAFLAPLVMRSHIEVVVVRFQGGGNHVLFRRPVPQINDPATIAAKWHIRAVPFDFFLADGTTNSRFRIRHTARIYALGFDEMRAAGCGLAIDAWEAGLDEMI